MSYELNAGGKQLAEVIEKVTWSGDSKQVARKLVFTVANKDSDRFLPKVNINEGDQVQFLEDGKLSLAPEILQGNVSVAMSSALTDVASALSLDPPAYAIGYSVYAYYGSYEEMMTDVTPNKLKLLAVDGVLPTAETIADGTYPLADYNYIVLRSDEPKDSPARRLAEFMVSDAGQQAVADSGFLPLAVK